MLAKVLPIIFLTYGGKLIVILGYFNFLKESILQIFMMLYAFVGVGFGTRRSFSECIERLDLKKPNLVYVLIGVLIIYFVDYFIWKIPYFLSYFLLQTSPELGRAALNYTITENSNVVHVIENIRVNIPSFFGVVMLCVIVGVGEELMFRGALQPRFGNLWTSLLFASLHYQYLSFITLVDVFLISYILGIIKNKSNTSTTILIHAIYDLICLI
ncbi:CPBP family intramembrane glutamic endopeptidase [Methanotorris formicicus]|uniref:Abortive infection protein n=1 Tax=Methanotorris formicicus Mc-S-70 TaxID=647171 RepID=H1KZR5_9EURY|nr:CPBP family intramembrane glutamic endopeptidase [Methanotorris formicicus]EHP85612.1 Abortive infection protein [Methanotorris formicicus Mc-S-70]